MSISKNTAKFIKSLHLKKYRKEEGLFLVEGEKSILEVLQSDFEILNVYITRELFEKYRDIFFNSDKNIEIVSEEELAKISSLEFNNTGVAIARQKDNTPLTIEENEMVVALDDIRDPGNFGTIIRTCDWYGIKKIICSLTTAELYNNKTIAASMGSFTRVKIFYTVLADFLNNTNVPIMGAELSGTNVHDFSFPKSGIILMGNESNGIHPDLQKYITNKITITRFGTAESLNVSMATGIILDNWRRGMI
jgi:TrmH family RNA methyltransferase